ncbi:carnitine O-palmitoyltransferase, putative, partial [Bodo saltans]
MAEARRAVDPFPSLTLDVSIDPSNARLQASVTEKGVSIFIPKPGYLVKNLWGTLKQAYLKMHQAFMPLPVPVVFTLVLGTVSFMALAPGKAQQGLRNSWLSNFVWRLDNLVNPFARGFHNELRVAYLSLNTSVGILFAFTFAHRALLRALLSYTGWMDETRGKKSLKTTIWGSLLKYLYIRGGSKVMLAYQTSLPNLPQGDACVSNIPPQPPRPQPQETTERYMLSMEPLLNAEERVVVEEELAGFLKNEGPKLQRYLKYKFWTSSNYLADWWLDFVYLRGRDSLMINSNFYGLGLDMELPTKNQAARAAFTAHTLLSVANEIENEKIPPMLIQGLVPMCMQQYVNAFATTRVPKMQQDVLEHHPESRHIIVMHKGRYFKLRALTGAGTPVSILQLYDAFDGILKDTSAASPFFFFATTRVPKMSRMFCYFKLRALTGAGTPVSILQLYDAFDGILKDTSAASPHEIQLGALTAWDRNKWAEAREQHFLRNKTNRPALESIERGLFVVSLDDHGYQRDEYTKLGNLYMHGETGSNRWFDKSANICVGPDGYTAINVEHSWADAPCFGHCFELSMARELRNPPYNPDGTLKAESTRTDALRPIPAERITFQLTDELKESITEASAYAKKLIADLDLVVRHFKPFGKNIMKKMKCSPDAFVQVALQLAYFRNQGKFVQTYESAMARLYVDGRTETIRSCTNQTAAFVRAVCDPSTTTVEERKKLLEAACANHSRLTALAMTGRGVDRHLFALYVVSVGTHTESPFLKRALSRGWKLSTSQTPMRQSVGEWPNEKDEGDMYPRPSGGFGPVADDGFGVSYVIHGE